MTRWNKISARFDQFGKLLSQNMIVHEKTFTASPQKYVQEGKQRQEVQLRKKKEGI